MRVDGNSKSNYLYYMYHTLQLHDPNCPDLCNYTQGCYSLLYSSGQEKRTIHVVREIVIEHESKTDHVKLESKCWELGGNRYSAVHGLLVWVLTDEKQGMVSSRENSRERH
jgi:hypothetical protein